ncbi:MAG: large conductance mechanosensitive channel protein MscL [Clostridiales Family XIII bacterium]|jgi:large conductance mechanosensitive channel|nr:large conductance mechanosensitive channel protein MscL [Clostridiales Family XIII bacterium]
MAEEASTGNAVEKKKGLIQEFKEFAFRGNVLDLAVAVVIGAAFNAIVQSFVNDLIMPLVGAIFSTKGLEGLAVTINGSNVTYGMFIAAVVNFFLVAIAVFILIKAINKLRAAQKKEEEEKAKEAEAQEAEEKEAVRKEVELLTEIRDLLKSGR